MQSFGIALARLRRARDLSQLKLGEQAGLSQRHISFLESGRAQPGQAALRKLIDGLLLSRREASELLAAASGVTRTAAADWFGPDHVATRNVAHMLLARHAPYPALIYQRCGHVLAENSGFTALINRAEATAGVARALRRNIYDLILHPDGLPRIMANPAEIRTHTLTRLRRMAAQDDRAAQTLRRLKPAVADLKGFAEAPDNTHAVLVENYRLDGQNVQLVTMAAGFGFPEDDLAERISIDLYFPANPGSADRLSKLAGRDKPRAGLAST
jgi:transcriptional regulator with XRE-family HTH domain